MEQMTDVAGGGGGGVQTGTLVEEPAPGDGARSRVRKVFVAVHGIGDQFNYATIQSVVNQVCSYHGKPAAVPLGSFHTGNAPFSLVPPYEPDPFEQYSFAEVYWADVPRSVVKDQHKLEEIKQWARTLVERLRLRWKQIGDPDRCRDQDFALIGQVLGEMIQTVSVLDRVTFLANRAGLFTFDLKPLFDDFVGDVQIVTEFTSEREKILAAFDSVMTRVHENFPEADIYVVAHSEGTVVAFLGLLEAFRDASQPSWANRLRGLMTIGSPIDKHLLLWPTLFAKGDRAADRPAWFPAQPIPWRNYYDHGDPVGFELNDARTWLRANGWDEGDAKVFEFEDEHDMGFSRYPLPGHAHVAYWTDPAVFGHFISTVVNRNGNAPGPRAKEFQQPPASIWWKRALAYVLPYTAIGAVLLVAAYLLVRALMGVIRPAQPEVLNTYRSVAANVVGIAALMFGITVASRVPRLTRDTFWRGVAFLIGVLGAGAYLLCVSVIAGQPATKGGGVLLVSAALTLLVYVLGVIRPSWGLTPLVVLGTVAAAGTAWFYVDKALEKEVAIGPVWPLVLAILGFLYLWWLAALFFDLVFVWHRYIRHSRALTTMGYVLGGKQPPTWGGRASPALTREGARHLRVS